MAAYLQYRVQQRGDVYGSASFPWGENLTVGSGTGYFLLAGIGTGICTGAIGGLEMIA